MKPSAYAALLLVAGTAFAAGAPDIQRVNGRIDIAASETAGDVSTVNGAIQIGDRAVTGSVRTVNGRIALGATASAQSLQTVNGAIAIGSGAHVAGGATTVNGAIDLSPSADVAGPLSNVNGKITVAAAHVGGGITTLSGDIDIEGQSHIDGGILIRQSCCWNQVLKFFGVPYEQPTVIIGPGATVQGPLTFERDVHLYVSDGAHIGPVKGTKPIVYSGQGPRTTPALADERTFDKHFLNVPPGGKLTVDTDVGSIAIVGHHEGRQIVVHAEMSGSGDFISRLDIKAVATSGSGIALFLPADVHGSMDAHTSGGRVEAEIPLSITEFASRSELRGDINGGGEPIYLRTSGGSIHVGPTD